MHALARLSILAFAVLFTACASRTPPPASVEQVVPHPATNFSSTADDVLLRASGLVGTPYRWGGNTLDLGFDCSGLINFVYHDMTDIKLPCSTREMISVRVSNVLVQALQTGDLVFFAASGGRAASHAGIYVDEGCSVHTPRTGGTVYLDGLQNSYWQRAYLNAKRVLTAPSPLVRML